MGQEQAQQALDQHQKQVHQPEKEQPGQKEQTAEAPMVTEQQPAQIVLPRQESRIDTLVLQTPQREDISRKRDKETPLTTSTTQGEKRQRLNPFQRKKCQ